LSFYYNRKGAEEQRRGKSFFILPFSPFSPSRLKMTKFGLPGLCRPDYHHVPKPETFCGFVKQSLDRFRGNSRGKSPPSGTVFHTEAGLFQQGAKGLAGKKVKMIEDRRSPAPAEKPRLETGDVRRGYIKTAAFFQYPEDFPDKSAGIV
jgi:hypothetical protein